MSATIHTTASFRRQQAIDAERGVLSAVNHSLFCMDTIRDVGAVLAGALRGASALYISFASCTQFGLDATVEAAAAAKTRSKALFTFLRPNLPESALDIASPEFQVFLKMLPHVDILQLTSDELFFICPEAYDPTDASMQICQRFNLKALVVFDDFEGSGFVASREMKSPAHFVCRPSHFGNLEEVAGKPSPFSRHILYSFLERGGVTANISEKDLLGLVRDAAATVSNDEPYFVN